MIWFIIIIPFLICYPMIVGILNKQQLKNDPCFSDECKYGTENGRHRYDNRCYKCIDKFAVAVAWPISYPIIWFHKYIIETFIRTVKFLFTLGEDAG